MDAPPQKKPLSPPEIVGVGASAGGVEALQTLIAALPADFGPAVVVVIHRRGDSRMPAILQRVSALPVRPIADGDPVTPGVVHVAADDRDVTVRDGRFAMGAPQPGALYRPSIDALLGSLADAYGPRAAGVVLSGALDDGVRGALRLFEVGARMLAQAPEEAAFASMPLNVAMRDHPEAILPLKELAAYLAAISPRAV